MVAAGQPGKPPPQYMPAPAAMSGVPPGLEYLSQIDQLLINQQVELLESEFVYLSYSVKSVTLH